MGQDIQTLPEIGEIVAGRFRIEEIIGSGGFGTVYRARQENIGRMVAIKFLAPEVTADRVIVERFRREAFHVSQLRHPNTVTLFDYGQSDEGLFYMVFELLEGQSLASVLQHEGALVPNRAAYIFQQMLESLSEAHSLGIIHRDMKPENVMLCEMFGDADYVKVLDFGVAKMTVYEPDVQRSQGSLTQDGRVFGTPMYMSPEQACGERVTPASDVYALGLILFELLTGEDPVQGRNRMELLQKQLVEPVPFMSANLERTPLGKIIRRATQKDPAKRYTQAQEMHVAFALALNRMGIRPQSRSHRFGLAISDADPDDAVSVDHIAGFEDTRIESRSLFEEVPSDNSDLSLSRTSSEEAETNDFNRDWESSDRIPFVLPSADQTLDQVTDPFVTADQPAINSSIPLGSSPQIRLHSVPPPLPESSSGEPSTTSTSTILYAHPYIGNRPLASPRRIDLHTSLDLLSPFGWLRTPNSRKRPPSQSRLVIPKDLIEEWRRRRISNQGKGLLQGRRPPMLGRTELLHHVTNQVAEKLSSDSPVVFLLNGRSGVGKTQFMTEFANRLHLRGFDVCMTCSRNNPMDLGSLLELVMEYWGITSLSNDDLQRILLSDVNRLELDDHHFDALTRLLFPEHTDRLTGPPMARYEVLAALTRAASEARPIALLFDDIESSDSTTLVFLRRFIQELAQFPVPICFGFSLRPEEYTTNPDLNRFFQQIQVSLEQGFFRFDLHPLHDDIVAHILDSRFRLDSDLRDRIVWPIQGAPQHALVAFEYLKATNQVVLNSEDLWHATPGHQRDFDLPPDLPTLLFHSLQNKVPLDTDGLRLRNLIETHAIIGFRTSVDLLSGLSPEPSKVSKDVDHLCDLGILVRSRALGLTFTEFSSLALFEVVHAHIEDTPENRARFEKVADGIQRFYDLLHRTPPYLHLSELWSAAGNRDKTIECLQNAADHAQLLGNLHRARMCLIDVLKRVDETKHDRTPVQWRQWSNIHYELAQIAFKEGEFGIAEDHFHQVVDLSLPNFPTSIDLTVGYRGLAHIAMLKGQVERARRSYSIALARSTELNDIEGIVKALSGISRSHIARSEMDAEQAVSVQLASYLPSLRNVQLKAMVAMHLAYVAHLRSDEGSRSAYYNEAEYLFRACDDKLGLVDCLLEQASALLSTTASNEDRFGPAQEMLEEVMALNEATDDSFRILETERIRGLLFLEMGELDKAKTTLEWARNHYTAMGLPYYASLCRMSLGCVGNHDGSLREAEQELQQAILVFDEMDDILASTRAMLRLSDTYIGLGMFDRARSVLEKSKRLVKGCGTTWGLDQMDVRLAFIAIWFGEFSSARQLLYTLIHPPSGDRGHESGMNPIQTFALSVSSVLSCFELRFVEAPLETASALNHAIELNHPRLLTIALGNAGFVSLVTGQTQKANEYFDTPTTSPHYYYYSRGIWLRWLNNAMENALDFDRQPETIKLLHATSQVLDRYGESGRARSLMKRLERIEE